MSINFPNDPATNPGNGGSWTDPDGNVWIVEIVAGEAIWTQQEAEVSEEPVIEWTLTANGSTDYIFSGTGFAGTETDPVVYVVRGQTYKFTNGMGAHPFQIQSTPGTSGTAYNDGITNNAVSNGTLTWEVRMDAPSTLYYQCTSHADMNGTIYVLDEGSSVASIDDLGDVDTSTAAPTDGQALVWDAANSQWEPGTVSGGGTSLPAAQDGEVLIYENGQWVAGPVIGGVDYTPTATDPNFNDVSLLLLGNGTNGSTTITDSSSSPLTVTANGDAQIGTGQSKFGGSSLYFPSSNPSYLDINSDSSLNLSGDFTVEAWIYITNQNSYPIIATQTTAWGSGYASLGLNASYQVESLLYGGSVMTGTTVVSVNTWYHVALTRVASSSTTRLFVNGVLESTSSNGAYDFSANGGTYIGKASTGTPEFQGYIDDLRVTKGVARYTANFTPPTAQLPTPSASQVTIPYSINNLEDVDTSTAAPTDGQALLWDNTAQKWEPGTVSSGGLPSGSSDGEALIWENGAWVTGPVIGGVDYTVSSGSQTSTYSAPTGYTHWNDTWTLGLGSPHSGFTVSADGLTVTFGGANEQNAGSSTAYNSGKYYVEIETTAGAQMQVGFINNLSNVWHHSSAFGVTVSSGNANTYVGGTSVSSGTINAASSGDVLMLAVDFDNKKFFYGINGTWENSGDPVAGTGEVISGWNTADYYFGVRNHSVGGVQTAIKHNYISTSSAQVTIPYSIDKLDDVDTSTVAPTDGQALLWDASNSKWEPGTVSTSGSGGGSAISTPWAPSDLTLSMWLDADDASTITESGGAVSAWNDKTTNAFNVAQATAANQPTLTANGLNGKSVITFDGTNDYLSVPPSIQAQPMTIALVCKANSTASSGGATGRSYVFDGMGTSSTGRAILALDGNNVGYPQMYAGFWVGDNTSTFDTDAHIFVLTFDGSSSSLKFDGGTAVTGNANTQGLTNGVTLGANYDQTADWFNGAIAEFIVLPAVSLGNQNKLEGYLAHKWGLEASLPAAHPYKSAAPVNEETTSLPSGTADGETLIWENGAWAVGPVIGGVDYTPSGDDANFSSVSLLLHGNGTNGSTTFTDSSSNSLTVTGTGTAQISTAQSKFGGASIYLPAGADKISVAQNALFDFGSSAWTMEMWVYWTGGSGGEYSLITNRGSWSTDALFWTIQSNGTMRIVKLANTYATSTSLSQNTWTHIATTYDGTYLKLFIDGVLDATHTVSGSWDWSDGGTDFGAMTQFTNQFTGYMDDIRITKGVARYTANFTVPTAELPGSGGQITIPYSIDKLEDVDTSTVAPTDGQALLWDNTASKWEPGSIAAGTSIENNRVETFTYEVTYYGGSAIVPGTSGEATVRNSNPALVRFNAQDKAGKDLLLLDEYSSPSSITIRRNGSDTNYPLTEFITQGGYFQIRTTNLTFALGDTLEFNFTRPAEGDYAALKADLTSYETVNGDVVRDIKPNDKLLTAASTVGHVYDSFQAGGPGTPTADGQYAIRYLSSTPLIRVWPNDTNGNAFDLHTVSYTGATGTTQKPYFYAWANGLLYKIPISSQIYSQSGYYQWYCDGGGTELGILQNAGSFRIVHPWEAYEDPQDGDVLTYDSVNKTYHPKASSGGSSTRTQVSGTTASIADGASADLTISGTGKAGQLLSIETDAAAWVTLYVSQATRTADASRTETTDPSPGSGVVAEVITTGAQTVLSTPSTAFFNNEATPASELYLKVVNKSGASAAISVTLKVIPIEV